ncbi:MAG TPA: septal ring lytic transglycosylase RlpA family protein [Candidatus Methylomirabilis sp.]|nr:septal ring lytic transglycosylase RlpA family protein [Candidatus Methylomirabilis sp.]
MQIQPGRSGALALAIALAIACGAAPARGQTPAQPSAPAASTGGALTGAVGETQTGLAAYYSHRLNGKRTASGERFNNAALTTGHQTLPFGTKVKVTNLKNNKSVVLRVNDRGPTQSGRVVDVTRAAAQKLGFVRSGLTEVKVEVVEAAKPRAGKKKR